MRRFLLTLLFLSMPLVAAGQALGSYPQDMASSFLQRQPDQVANVGQGVTVPLWRGADGHMLALQVSNATSTEAQRNTPLSFSAVDAGAVKSSNLQYILGPSLTAHAGVTQRSWVNSAPQTQIIGSEVGATYNGGPYSLGLSVGSDSTPNSGGVTLPRVLPGVAPGVNGLSGFDSSTQLNANGRLALGGTSGINLGASVGRIRLLPGNLLGLSTLDQKALTFGVDHGSISGNIIGRTMQPEAGMPGGYSPDKRWSSIDLGVTWRLPWQGSLSFGAQNVWSSGNATNTPVGPEPDQSRTPYVQYHQDL